MNTFKKIEKYQKIKKTIIGLTVLLVIVDTIIAFANPAYTMSSSAFIGLGISSYSLMKEYEGYRIEHREVSKALLLFLLVIAGFSLYHLVLNVLNVSGGAV